VDSEDIEEDDAATAREGAKDFLVYLGAFEDAELDDWSVAFTEGAESGMSGIWASKALEIARTTCNRDIWIFHEVPAYSYSENDAADRVNTFASSFYNSEECSCFNTTTCNEPVVTISKIGWLPLTPYPEAEGADGLMYPANSASPLSPWFESLVWPENPTGKMKTPQLPNVNRRVCDGVYVWPMYFGMTVSLQPSVIRC
jgi:hypothetical protein